MLLLQIKEFLQAFNILQESIGWEVTTVLALLVAGAVGATLSIKALWKSNQDKDKLIMKMVDERIAQDRNTLDTLNLIDKTLSNTIAHQANNTQRLVDATQNNCQIILTAIETAKTLIATTRP